MPQIDNCNFTKFAADDVPPAVAEPVVRIRAREASIRPVVQIPDGLPTVEHKTP